MHLLDVGLASHGVLGLHGHHGSHSILLLELVVSPPDIQSAGALITGSAAAAVASVSNAVVDVES